MNSPLTLYQNAVLRAQQQDWDLATAALDAAYRAAPPLELSLDDCQTLRRHRDELAVVGQQLPCLTPTLQLFSRFLSLSA